MIGAALDAWMLHPGWVRGVTTPTQAGVKLEAMVDHIDHVCQLAGNARHAAVGTDLDGGFGTEQTPCDLDTIADLQRLPEMLGRRGYQPADVDGIMFGKPSTFIGKEEFGKGEMKPRELHEPGTYYEYNDVRINRMSLSLLQLWKRPLPEVLKAEIMEPIGASDTWVYHGYENSVVEIDGKRMESVSGGTRWGGGLWINTRDMARFGYLFLRRGNWKGNQIISENWIKMATTPTTIGQDYGFLWWLNTQGKQYPDAPRNSFSALGAGSNTIWIDPEHDLVVVWRWHRDRSANELFKKILAAVVEKR